MLGGLITVNLPRHFAAGLSLAGTTNLMTETLTFLNVGYIEVLLHFPA